MSIRINLPENQDLAAVQARFAEEDQVRKTLVDLQDARPKIAFNRLYRFATGATSHDAELQTELRQNADLARDFNTLLQKVSWSYLPQVAAASTDEKLGLRETDLCAIRIEPSRAEPDQVYVIIELKDRTAISPKSLITTSADGSVETLELPEDHEGVIQLLLQADDVILLALQSHGTEVYLR
jgi:hypothetical protein